MAVIIILFLLKKLQVLNTALMSLVSLFFFLNKMYPFPSDTAKKKKKDGGGAKIDTSEDIQENMSRNRMAFPKEAFQKCLHKDSPIRRVSRLRLFSVASNV